MQEHYGTFMVDIFRLDKDVGELTDKLTEKMLNAI